MVDQNPESSHPVEFEKSKRPKLGIGVMILNELDEVIVS